MESVNDNVERLSVDLLDELARNRTADVRNVDLRFTALKCMAKSPAHYKHAALVGGDDSISKRLGSGAHALTFGTPRVVEYTKRRAGKEWEAFEADHPDALILSAREYAQAKAIAAAIRRNEVAERLLFSNGTIVEQRIDWEHKGRKCRSTPDARMFRTLVELKTCRSADPYWFQRDAVKMAYHAQLAFYRQAIKAVTDVECDDVYIIAVENKAPYAVTPFKVSERALEQGWALCKKWMEQLRVCETTNYWPEYTLNIELLDLYDDEATVALAMRNDDGERAEIEF